MDDKIPTEKSAKVVLAEWQCHKRVKAGKITQVFTPGTHTLLRVLDENDVEQDMIETVEYYEKHKPQAFGYYVMYEDGYTSYSPQKAFKDGYTSLSNFTDTTQPDPAEK